jgi:HEAT repeat protein
MLLLCGAALLFVSYLSNPCAFAAEPPRLTCPTIDPKTIGARPVYGDLDAVNLLGGMLDSEDLRVREQVTVELGQTHNAAAMRYLRQARQDESISVRAAAVSAAGELGGPKAETMVAEALNSHDLPVVLAAMRAVVKLELVHSAGSLQGLVLFAREPLVRAVALRSLTALDHAASEQGLAKALADASARVRLRAAENALMLKQAEALLEPLRKMADEDRSPAVRAATVEAVGRFDPEGSAELLVAASKNANPLIRLAAVRAWRKQGKAEQVAPMLSDRSPNVRLAAIRVAGDMKTQTETKKVFKLMLAAADEQTHMVARRSLLQIRSTELAALAAATLPKQVEKLKTAILSQKAQPKKKPKKTPAKKKKDKSRSEVVIPLARTIKELQRNASACCYILGELRSKENYDYLLKVLGELGIDSPVIAAAAIALGKIGDQRAVEPLEKLLKKCQKVGVVWLRLIHSLTPPPPYSQEVTGRVMEALGMLRAVSAVDTINTIIRTSYQGDRLDGAVDYAVRVLPKLLDAPQSEKFILEILEDESFGILPRSRAAAAAGRMKLRKALPTLRVILDEDRPSLDAMRIAAWAIQEITGQTPTIPEPHVKLGDWIIKRLPSGK